MIHHNVAHLVNPDLVVVTETSSLGTFYAFKLDGKELWFGPHAFDDRQTVTTIVGQLRHAFTKPANVSMSNQGKRLGKSKVSIYRDAED